jgi:hypothetical protein
MIWLAFGIPIWMVLLFVAVALNCAAGNADAATERMVIQRDEEKHAPVLHERLR